MAKEKGSTDQGRIPREEEHTDTPETVSPEKGFPIVGIGASAGGLEALELFLESVPQGAGMAFVIVQHLDPTRKGYLVELLNRRTDMEVSEVEDKTRVRPNSVYIIPPNKDLSLFHGMLHLFEPAAPRGLRLPVDFFFKSLADDMQERAIGVILSGMGSDGTFGLKSIKERGGVVLAQEPDQARFDSMPSSAISTGLVDMVAPAEELPARIAAYVEHGNSNEKDRGLSEHDKKAFDNIIIQLRSGLGHDFSSYRRTTLYRRVERRLGIHQIDDLATYARFLQNNPQELQVLFKELLIGVTRFFRDPESWEKLGEQIASAISRDNVTGQPMRAWVAGCSTGEEAYSLAIVFKEAQRSVETGADLSLQIFATDLDSDAVDKARQGLYPTNIAADVSPERLSHFFTEEEGGYRIRQDIRDMVVFAPHNLISDPPFTNLDILSCRNLLIYLDPELQKKLLTLFHYSLNPGGLIFLGGAESIGSATDRFEQITPTVPLYRRLQSPVNRDLMEFPSIGFHLPAHTSRFAKTKPKANREPANLEGSADQLILKKYAPAAVLVNEQGDVLYTRGSIGKYLELPAGKANWNIFAMTHSGMRFNLSKGFEQAVRTEETVSLSNVNIETDRGEYTVDVTIEPLANAESLSGSIMIIFTDVRTSAKSSEARKSDLDPTRVTDLEFELQQSRRELQELQDEMQSYQEELLSAYEELQSTNEELQSTNEEITTSREELQSLNEELTSVNYELQTKVDGLSRANNDLNNLLESTDIATLFLDGELRVRLYTAETAKIIKLIPGDVGRPITDIVSDLVYPDLADDARDVLKTLAFSEREIPTNDGRFFKVRIMPYRTLDDKIDGLVITFADITASKKLEKALREGQTSLEDSIVAKDKELDGVREQLESETQEKRGKRAADEDTENGKSGRTPDEEER